MWMWNGCGCASTFPGRDHASGTTQQRPRVGKCIAVHKAVKVLHLHDSLLPAQTPGRDDTHRGGCPLSTVHCPLPTSEHRSPVRGRVWMCRRWFAFFFPLASHRRPDMATATGWRGSPQTGGLPAWSHPIIRPAISNEVHAGWPLMGGNPRPSASVGVGVGWTLRWTQLLTCCTVGEAGKQGVRLPAAPWLPRRL